MIDSAYITTPDARLSALAPRFRVALLIMLGQERVAGREWGISETIRNDARQRYLYASGRTRPGPILTNARTVWQTWHGYGLAADLYPKWGWDKVTRDEWALLALACRRNGLATGLAWTSVGGGDGDHVQWGELRVSPSPLATLYLSVGGLPYLWRRVGAS